MHENLHKIRDCFKFLRYPSTEMIVCNISVEKVGFKNNRKVHNATRNPKTRKRTYRIVKGKPIRILREPVN
jgi:hypothetical protein